MINDRESREWRDRHEQPAEPHPAWQGDKWCWWAGPGPMTAEEKQRRDAEEGWIEL